MIGTEPKIIDLTVKEGGFRVHNRMLPEHVADIARGLEQSGVQYMEVCHGLGVGAFTAGFPGLYPDEDLLEAARVAAPNLQYSVFIYPSFRIFPIIKKLAPLFSIGRVAANLDEIEHTFPHIQLLHELNKTLFVQLDRIHLFPPEKIAETAAIFQAKGAEVIYLADTFGSMDAGDVRTYFAAVKKACTLPLGFHGKNATGQAIANSLAALESGAEWVDGSLGGMGMGAGMTPLEILVAILQSKGKSPGIDLNGLANTLRYYVIPALHTYPHVTYSDLILAKHRMDFYPVYLLEKFAEVMDIPLDDFLVDLRRRVSFTQLRDKNIRTYLAEEQLDFDVVLEYFRTGRVPESDSSDAPS